MGKRAGSCLFGQHFWLLKMNRAHKVFVGVGYFLLNLKKRLQLLFCLPTMVQRIPNKNERVCLARFLAFKIFLLNISTVGKRSEIFFLKIQIHLLLRHFVSATNHKVDGCQNKLGWNILWGSPFKRFFKHVYQVKYGHKILHAKTLIFPALFGLWLDTEKQCVANFLRFKFHTRQ